MIRNTQQQLEAFAHLIDSIGSMDWATRETKMQSEVALYQEPNLTHYKHTAYVELRNESGMQNGTIRNQDL